MRTSLPRNAPAFLCLPMVLALLSAAAAAELSFNKDIRPILVENCFGCHGADSASRQAGLRLDDRDAAVEMGAIVPGDPDSSVALDRIFSDDPDEVMPPPTAKKELRPEQKELLKRWIAAGAEYEPHWSFIPPTRPQPPAVKDETWVRTPIDRFILARLEAEGLAPAPEADRRTLARRVALDLTGLPPEPDVVEAFVADARPDAYERLVDRLLATNEWGEHRGRHWLDYARYADTHGIHYDNYREMWTYRQWVVNAFNRNVPFDQFTILQLAGDLVAHDPARATPQEILDARIASGFNRCNMTTNEGGVIPEEYAVLYTRDRTETTAAVWLGLTAGCAVCHNHKFDPLSQKEFYELAAFFNNTTQNPMDGNVHNTPPILPVPGLEDRPRFDEIETRLPEAKAVVEGRRQEAKSAFDAWIAAATPETVAEMLPQETPLVKLALAEGEGAKTKATLLGKEMDLPLAETAKWQAGPVGTPALLLNGRAAELPASGDFEQDQPFTIAFWIRPPGNDSSYAVLGRMDDTKAHRGWDVYVAGRRVAVHMIHAWPADAFKVVASDQLKPDAWTLVTVTYDGSGKAEGLQIQYDGQSQSPRIENNTFKKSSIRTEVPLTIGSRSPGSPAHGVGLADLRIWGRGLSAGEIKGLAEGQRLGEIVKLPVAERSKAAGQIYEWWLASRDEPFQKATAAVVALEAERAEILKRGTIAHVMQEKNEMAKAHILARGEYDKRGEEVRADTPDILPAFPADLPKNRLGLAKWLLLQDHPLTTRVTVNRFWQEVFGTGLVRSSGDFGTTGELPSHPELLDWLAIEFREQGWDVKQLFRLMVTSAAYRQSAATTPEKLVKDRDNRLLSRGPRFRLDAEAIRDQALAASGLLVRQIGGPSVKPYQPEGVWEAVAMIGSNTRDYKADSGPGLYRRSMYWFWKRSAPPASMEVFNAPARENCTVKRERTNTPLQALVTLNDPQFVEAARALADKTLAIGGDDEARIDFLARRLLSRPFAAEELAIVKRSLADLTQWYKDHPTDAGQVIAVGASKPTATDAPTLAAWTMLTNQLMNLDEFLCK